MRTKPPHPPRLPLPGCISFSVHLTNGLHSLVSTSPGSICTPALQRQAAPSVHSSLPRQMLHQGDLPQGLLSTLDPPRNKAMPLSPTPLREPRQQSCPFSPPPKPSLLFSKLNITSSFTRCSQDTASGASTLSAAPRLRSSQRAESRRKPAPL